MPTKKDSSPTPPDLPEENKGADAQTSQDAQPGSNASKKTDPAKARQAAPKKTETKVEEDFSDSPVDVKLVKHLMALFEESDLGELEVSQGDFLLRLGKAGTAPAIAAMPQFAAPVQAASSQAGSTPVPEEDPNHFYIKAPMVGTFYRSPSPDQDAFVDIGQKVQEKTTVCIIEAMKVMNELPADCSGTIVDILVENGNGVEYGQPLFKVARN